MSHKPLQPLTSVEAGRRMVSSAHLVSHMGKQSDDNLEVQVCASVLNLLFLSPPTMLSVGLYFNSQYHDKCHFLLLLLLFTVSTSVISFIMQHFIAITVDIVLLPRLI